MSTAQIFSTRREFSAMVSANIRAEAARRGISQSALAKAIGVAQTAVGSRYRDERQWQLDDLQAVAEVLGMEPWELCTPPAQMRKGPARKRQARSGLVAGTGFEPATSGL